MLGDTVVESRTQEIGMVRLAYQNTRGIKKATLHLSTFKCIRGPTISYISPWAMLHAVEGLVSPKGGILGGL
jgi:hypothetical protein